jgi:photosystem II stability/assembly factor-like uncharacterized protein
LDSNIPEDDGWNPKETVMKNEGKVLAGGVSMILLAACNLAAPGTPTFLPWDTLRVSPQTRSLPAGGYVELTETETLATPTITRTPTGNPLSAPRLEAGSSIDILRLEMLDEQNGWGIGGPRATGNAGHVFRTQDGGQTWFDVTPPETVESAAEVPSMAAVGYFADAQTGWVTYHARIPSGVPKNPVVWRTVDGGVTWQSGAPLITEGLTETYWVSHIVFSGLMDGWVLVHVGAGMNHDYVAVYRSTDGGATWIRTIDPMIDGGIQSCTKTGMAFADGSNGWLTGDCNGVRPGAFLFRTKDGGSQWESVALTAPPGHPDLFTAEQYACRVRAPFLQNGQALLGVECADMGDPQAAPLDYLYRFSPSGGTPVPQAYPGGDLFTLDGNRIWALAREIFRSDSAGVSWTKISSVTWDGQFDFVTNALGWAAVQKESEYGLVKTTDGGSLWVQLLPVVAASS